MLSYWWDKPSVSWWSDCVKAVVYYLQLLNSKEEVSHICTKGVATAGQCTMVRWPIVHVELSCERLSLGSDFSLITYTCKPYVNHSSMFCYRHNLVVCIVCSVSWWTFGCGRDSTCVVFTHLHSRGCHCIATAALPLQQWQYSGNQSLLWSSVNTTRVESLPHPDFHPN